jgi:hypothetical protein
MSRGWRMGLAMRGESEGAWPALPQADWSETCVTLQLWMQIVGKIRLALMPAINHAWSVTLYPTVRGLTTSPMPYGARTLQIDFDFVAHVLVIESCGIENGVAESGGAESSGVGSGGIGSGGGGRESIPLRPMTVASFYGQVMAGLEAVGTPVRIWPVPVEIAQPIPFEEDETHRAYDAAYAWRFWRVLLQTTRVFTVFRARFTGKVSPIHLFWGALDLACTRFSGRLAPEHPSMAGLPDRVTRDAYSHEVSSCGFWPGGGGFEALFYSYAYPEPAGYAAYAIAPAQARFDATLGEFVLPYEAVRGAADPDAVLLQFLESTYEAAANCARWDRAALETATGSG